MARDEERIALGTLTATPMRERGERPDGRRYWRIRSKATRETVASGWWTLAEVTDRVAELHRTPPSPRLPRGATGGRTVGDLCALWGQAQVRRHEAGQIATRSLAIYRLVVRHWLASPVAEIVVDKLTRPRVGDQAIAWRASGVSARSVDYDVRALQQIVAWGAERDLCRAVDVRVPSSVRADEYVYCGRVPTRDEVARALDAMKPGPYRDAAEILSLTGARVGEVVALRVGDVTAAGLRLSGRDEQRGRRGKTRPRLFPLSGRLSALARALAGERDSTAPLLDLPQTGSRRVQDRLAWASDLAGVERVTPHGIRRLVVSELLEVADARTVGELTGHSVSVMLSHYVRPRAEQLADVVERAKLGNVVPIRRRAQVPEKGGDE